MSRGDAKRFGPARAGLAGRARARLCTARGQDRHRTPPASGPAPRAAPVSPGARRNVPRVRLASAGWHRGRGRALSRCGSRTGSFGAHDDARRFEALPDERRARFAPPNLPRGKRREPRVAAAGDDRVRRLARDEHDDRAPGGGSALSRLGDHVPRPACFRRRFFHRVVPAVHRNPPKRPADPDRSNARRFGGALSAGLPGAGRGDRSTQRSSRPRRRRRSWPRFEHP